MMCIKLKQVAVGKTISLRDTIFREVVSFLKKEKMNCKNTRDGLVSLVNQLVSYKEEGKNLFPKIYIVDDLSLVLKSLPMSQFCIIERGSKTGETMLRALKKCAPLTEGDWSIYIQRDNGSFSYGVFRAGVSLLSVSIEDTLINNGAKEVKVILIHQISDKLIEIKGVTAKPLLINFGGREEKSKSPVEKQVEFVNTIIKQVHLDLKEQTFTFFKQIFYEILKMGHGTLACTIKSSRKVVPHKLRDGIILQERINIPKVIEELRMNNDLQANSKLNGFFSLVIGMLQSDGVTVFTDSGEIIAYNVFVKHPNTIVKKDISGGARSRTLLTLESLLGKDLESVYFQSQDGNIEIK